MRWANVLAASRWSNLSGSTADERGMDWVLVESHAEALLSRNPRKHWLRVRVVPADTSRVSSGTELVWSASDWRRSQERGLESDQSGYSRGFLRASSAQGMRDVGKRVDCGEGLWSDSSLGGCGQRLCSHGCHATAHGAST